MVCHHCGRTGHEKKDCWRLIGYPDWWNEKNEGGRGSTGGRGRGSYKNTSGRGRGTQLRSNVAQVDSQPTSYPTFTSEQWAALGKLVEQQKTTPIPERLSGKEQTGEVILDTGASHHMTGDIRILSELRDIVSRPVNFADGSHVLATQCGCLFLSQHITLESVLFVPNLNCTLLSVAKLLKQTGCFAIFTDTLCVLQDRFTRTLIGVGEERDGVYLYRDVGIVKANKSKVSEDQFLWHRRLGHPSFSTLSYLPFLSGFKNVSEKFGGCDICFQSKQTREVFIDSFNKATDCFDLIHCDLWGPYRVPSSCGAVYFLTIMDDYSRTVWIYLLLEKSEVKTVLSEFISMVSRQFGKLVKTVRSDNGTEFMCLSRWFRERGILH